MQLTSLNIARANAACDAIADLMDTHAFRRRFSGMRLLRLSQDIRAIREQLPDAFLPFMTDSSDVYAFDLGTRSGERVVVWNDHAVVADWPSFEAFVSWLRGTPGAA